MAIEPWGLPGCVIFLTMWGVHFTNLALLCSIWASLTNYDVSLTKYIDLDYKSMAILFKTVALPIDLLVTTISWTIIIPWHVQNVGWQGYDLYK